MLIVKVIAKQRYIVPSTIHIYDVPSINNHNFHNYVHLIYLDELETKDTKNSDISASYLGILLNIYSNRIKPTTFWETNTIPILMHHMRISTNKVSSVVLWPKKLEI
jgi:hypothetical protein